VRVRGIGASEREEWEGEQLGEQLRTFNFQPVSSKLVERMVSTPWISHLYTHYSLL
jgi:5-oxoprolinase (ATP-hydrolysing)